MGRFLSKDQRGFGHMGIIIAVVVLVAVGGVGWMVWDKKKNDTPLRKAINSAKCSYDDKDICKFFASWKATDNYSIDSTGTAEGQTVKTTVQVEGKDKTHVTFSGGLNYETITIGNALYTKAGDTWYKQTLTAEEAKNYQGDIDVDFTEPTNGGKITYTKVGTEDCDKRKCFKYEVKDADSPDTKQFLWFDTKDYQLRKMEMTSSDGSTFAATFTYDKASVSEPSPVKELGENQYIIPGQSEPTTLPGAGDTDLNEQELQDLLNQYQ
ncbi:MAG TPA: hypothetical protein VFB59_05625 [Candidatus Saccharimonadales bacterium]|nr:hypothetical protein [Candidatus Saccharimonadales bacterium]